MRRRWLALAACLALVLTSGGTAGATVMAGTGKAVTAAERLPAGDGPPGFWWGTDSCAGHGARQRAVQHAAPRRRLRRLHRDDRELGVLAGLQRPGSLAWSLATNARRRTPTTLTYHRGVGTGVYWFMGGPGVDPHYNGTAGEAIAWGAQQAARTLIDIANAGTSTTRSS